MAAASLGISARHRHDSVLRKKRDPLFPGLFLWPLVVDFLTPRRSHEPTMHSQVRSRGFLSALQIRAGCWQKTNNHRQLIPGGQAAGQLNAVPAQWTARSLFSPEPGITGSAIKGQNLNCLLPWQLSSLHLCPGPERASLSLSLLSLVTLCLLFFLP